MTQDLFKMLTVKRWVEATIDRFASEKNHVFPGLLGVDGFAFNWTGEFSWLVPPVYLTGKSIKHFCLSKAYCKAILVCPSWTSATF